MKEGKSPRPTKKANKRETVSNFEKPPFPPPPKAKKYDLFHPLDFEAFNEYLKDFDVINDVTLVQYFKKKSRSYIRKIRMELAELNVNAYQRIRLIITYRDTFDIAVNDWRAFYKKVSLREEIGASKKWTDFIQRNNLSSKAQFCNDEFYNKFRQRQEQNFGILKRYLLVCAWKEYKLRNTDLKLLERDQSQIGIEDTAILLVLNNTNEIEKITVQKKPDARILAFKTLFLQKAGDLEYFGNSKIKVIEYGGKVLKIGGDNFYNIYNSLKGHYSNKADQAAIKGAIKLLINHPKALELAKKELLDND